MFIAFHYHWINNERMYNCGVLDNLIGRSLQRIFFETYEEFINTILRSCNIDPSSKQKPLKVS